MDLIKLGKKGQVSIPQSVLRNLGLAPETSLLVETTHDGAIVLRQVSIHPVEIYSQQRLDEFAHEDAPAPDLPAGQTALLDRFNRQLGRRGENLALPAVKSALNAGVPQNAAPKAGRARRR